VSESEELLRLPIENVLPDAVHGDAAEVGRERRQEADDVEEAPRRTS
jgi:hypothetical protein